MPDKYKATWVSHSSIGDFLKCPRLYYLRAVYKDPITNHKVTLMNPHLALGQVVHDVVESLSVLPAEERLSISPVKKFEAAWKKVSGKKGGFTDSAQEEDFKQRGIKMLKKIEENPGPITNKAIKIPQELPHYWLSENDEIILCGKIDWLEYLEDSNKVHIIDFKTGRNEEDAKSLQLPIYHLLVKNTQKREVGKASYWYLDFAEEPSEVQLPDLKEAYEKVYEIAKRVKLARQLEHFKCPTNGCKHCIPMEKIIRGKAELVGTSDYNQDIYIL